VIGETTEAELVQWLGEPQWRSSSSNGGAMLRWMHHKMRLKATNFIPIVNLFHTGADTKNKTLQVILGPDGTVQSFSEEKMHLK